MIYNGIKLYFNNQFKLNIESEILSRKFVKKLNQNKIFI
jgi:hypothetical protein